MVVLKWSSWWLARRKEVKILFCSAIHTQDQKPYWGAPEVTVTLLATVAVSLNQKYNNKEEEKILPGWGDYRVISHNVILNPGFYSVQIAPGPHVKLSPPPVNQDLERAPQLLTQTRPFKIRSDLKKCFPFWSIYFGSRLCHCMIGLFEHQIFRWAKSKTANCQVLVNYLSTSWLVHARFFRLESCFASQSMPNKNVTRKFKVL